MALRRENLTPEELERQRSLDRSWSQAQRDLADAEIRRYLEESLHRLDAAPPLTAEEFPGPDPAPRRGAPLRDIEEIPPLRNRSHPDSGNVRDHPVPGLKRSPIVPVGAVMVPRWRCVVPALAQRLAVPVAEAAVLPAGGGADAAPLAAERTTTDVTGGRADEVFEELPTSETAERPLGMRMAVVPDRIEKRLTPVGRKVHAGAPGGLHPWGHRVVCAGHGNTPPCLTFRHLQHAAPPPARDHRVISRRGRGDP